MKKKKLDTIGNYLIKRDIEFIHTGCTLLDCVLGGGWSLRRIVNLVGDTGSSKTGLSIEAAANFRRQYPDGLIYYHEAESAFDLEYAYKLGLPEDAVIKEDIEEISDVYTSILSVIDDAEKKELPALYILDSLDGIKLPKKSEGELAGGYDAAQRAKAINQLITDLAGPVKRANMCLFIVSQVRDNIGVMFGEKKRRAGGEALNFYASQIVWLAITEKIKKTVDGKTRPYGIGVRAKCKKNKVGPSFRECDFKSIFYYGVDDVLSNLLWLKDIKGALEELGIKKEDIQEVAKTLRKDKNIELIDKIRDMTIKSWKEIDNEFMPETGKYE